MFQKIIKRNLSKPPKVCAVLLRFLHFLECIKNKQTFPKYSFPHLFIHLADWTRSFGGNPKVFVPLGVLLAGRTLNISPGRWSMRHHNQTPPHLVPLDVEERWLYSQLLLLFPQLYQFQNYALFKKNKNHMHRIKIGFFP